MAGHDVQASGTSQNSSNAERQKVTKNTGITII